MRSELFDYQVEILSNVTTTYNGLYVAVGKGKTIMALTLFEQGGRDKLLVICPNSKIEEWVEDARYELGLDLIALNKGTAINRELLKEKSDGYVIMNENVSRVKRELTALISPNWHIIVDESQSIKNLTSKSTRDIVRLGKKTQHKTLLSGTPQSKGWEDYYPQMQFLGAIDMSFKKWRHKYCALIEFDQGGYVREQIVGYKEEIEEFAAILYEHCQFYFPEESTSKDIIVPLPKHESYDRMRKQRVLDRVRAGSMGVLHQYLKQLSSGFLKDKWYHHHKLDAFEDVMRKHMDEDIVVFYNLDEEAYGIRSICIKRPVYEYSGRDKSAVEYMTSDREENAIILVQYKAGGTGINWLTKARVGWFHSLPDRHPPYVQARGRLDRTGQTRQCIFYIPITEGTTERANYEVIEAGQDFDSERQREALAELQG